MGSLKAVLRSRNYPKIPRQNRSFLASPAIQPRVRGRGRAGRWKSMNRPSNTPRRREYSAAARCRSTADTVAVLLLGDLLRGGVSGRPGSPRLALTLWLMVSFAACLATMRAVSVLIASRRSVAAPGSARAAALHGFVLHRAVRDHAVAMTRNG